MHWHRTIMSRRRRVCWQIPFPIWHMRRCGKSFITLQPSNIVKQPRSWLQSSSPHRSFFLLTHSETRLCAVAAILAQMWDLGRSPILLPSLSSHSQANLLTCSVNMNLPSTFQLSLVFCCKTLQRMSQWQQVSLSHCLRRNHELALLLADSFRNLGCACPSS